MFGFLMGTKTKIFKKININELTNNQAYVKLKTRKVYQ